MCLNEEVGTILKTPQLHLSRQIDPGEAIDRLSPMVLVGSLGWILLTTMVRHAGLLFRSANLVSDRYYSGMLTALAQALLIGLPLVVLAWKWKNLRFRELFRALALASLSLILLAPIHLVENDETQISAAMQILILWVNIQWIGFIIRRNYPRQAKLDGETRRMVKAHQDWLSMIAAALGLITLTPWMIYGALGSILDSIFQFSLAIELGILAAGLIEFFVFAPIQRNPGNYFQDYLLASLCAGGVLVILASSLSFAFGGIQSLLAIALPGLGWSLAALWIVGRASSPQHTLGPAPEFASLAHRARIFSPITVLVALSAAGPLLFFDPDELNLVISLSADEILFVGLRAARLAFMINLGCLIPLLPAIWGYQKRASSASPSAKQAPGNVPLLLAGVLILLTAILASGYVLIGQPGFFGERMFVILNEQSDVSMASEIEDDTARRERVYTTLTRTANKTQARLRQALEAWHIPYTGYYLVNALEVPDNLVLRTWLSFQPEVNRILDSPRLRPLPEPADSSLMQGSPELPDQIPWNLKLIGADRVWEELGITGEGILIGQSDSGVQWDHPDLIDQYRGANGQHAYNWLDPWNGSLAPVDPGGHGTHTLGTAVGRLTGVAPGAEWIACVNLARNLGNPAFYLDCMQFMLAPFPQFGDPFTQGEPSLGAQIINNSWGCPEFEGCDAMVFLPAVQALRSAGIFIVAGAGNDGPGCSTINSPLPVYDEVFSIGAIDQLGNLAFFSSLGPVLVDRSQRIKPDLVAPGVDVLSTLPGATYGTYSGTSMAGPHVAGVVALMWSANPGLLGEIELTEMLLAMSASPYKGSLPGCPGDHEHPSTATGYGILDAYRAVQLALSY